MPIYEFKCSKCNKISSKLLPIGSNLKNIECSKCGGEAKKILSTNNFRINGYSYKNGYSRGNK